MFYFLNKHNVLQLVLIVPLLVWAGYTIFTQMAIQSADGQSFLYRSVYPFLSTHPLQLKLLACLIVISGTLFIQFFYSESKFSDNQTFMPALVSLLFVNVGHFLTLFTPAFFTLLFFSFIIFLNVRLEHDKPIKNRVYTSGILVALATLFDAQAVWMVLFMILSLIANRISKTKEIIILLLGLLMVYVYVFVFFFMTDRMMEMVDVLRHLQLLTIVHQFLNLQPLQYALAGYSVLLLLLLIAILKMYYDNKLIIIRKRFVTTWMLTFVVLLMALFSGLAFHDNFLYLLLPMCLLMSMICLVNRRKFVHDFFLIVMLVLLWL